MASKAIAEKGNNEKEEEEEEEEEEEKEDGKGEGEEGEDKNKKKEKIPKSVKRTANTTFPVLQFVLENYLMEYPLTLVIPDCSSHLSLSLPFPSPFLHPLLSYSLFLSNPYNYF
jgi:hypothetical protein